jgi:hypothetical protein
MKDARGPSFEVVLRACQEPRVASGGGGVVAAREITRRDASHHPPGDRLWVRS